jgi:hypothetical protein
MKKRPNPFGKKQHEADKTPAMNDRFNKKTAAKESGQRKGGKKMKPGVVKPPARGRKKKAS